MAYGLNTRMFLAAEPLPERDLAAERASAVWRQLHADERLRAVERRLRAA
ncbi:hypothetical protein M8312_03155 [Sphingomonas sp. KRR8]|nr:hypothetical protein [Sphingomonas sp. KRR8]URD61529.1 hypothetical protein M8312_03155 [Sphingomonas sp. KRR8]